GRLCRPLSLPTPNTNALSFRMKRSGMRNRQKNCIIGRNSGEWRVESCDDLRFFVLFAFKIELRHLRSK
ncbi:MAG: hypothetical protein JXQ69_00885, partial [Paludibacteraceae bacterium]|nr:hypothetical protein [Paludibacteraceae bacterium]